jgi:hypothetical protein
MNWSNQPPAESSNHGYRLVRCPPYKPLRAIILSQELIGTKTHFSKGRTLPCEGPGCEACKEGLPWRWHAYLAILIGGEKEKAVLELTAQAAEQLKTHIEGYGSLRGAEMLAERPSKKPNGRVRIAVRLNGTPPASLPEAPNIQSIMMHIWGLDDRQLEDKPTQKPFKVKRLTQLIGNSLPMNDSATP